MIAVAFASFLTFFGLGLGARPYMNYAYTDPYPQQVYNEPYYVNPYGSNADTYGTKQVYGYVDPYSGGYSNNAQAQYNPYAYLKSGGYGQQQTGYGHPQTAYVPVVKRSKKKQKIISIDKGLHIAGGTQAFGKFKSLKSCMKACASAPNCFAGDYNPWLGRCYFHSNQTACNTMSAHSKLTHFKKIPCTVSDTNLYQVNLGSQLFGGIEQKGIKSLASCIKKCVNAGSGLASSPAALATEFRGGQRCYGIDYDFASHKCFFHTNLIQRPVANTLPLCPTADGGTISTPIDLSPNAGVVNIIICPNNP